jgi:hypothetical protein
MATRTKSITPLYFPRAHTVRATNATREEASNGTGEGQTREPEAASAASLFLAGTDPAALALELRGVNSSTDGRGYASNPSHA